MSGWRITPKFLCVQVGKCLYETNEYKDTFHHDGLTCGSEQRLVDNQSFSLETGCISSITDNPSTVIISPALYFFALPPMFVSNVSKIIIHSFPYRGGGS